MQSNYNQRKQRFCDNAASQAMDNAALGGFQHLRPTDPIADSFSLSSTADQLKTDLAARQLEHSLEAWHYLSQSVMALLNNQANIAVHLAYYAEVRAANSLLAATGISNKENPSHYLDVNANVHPIKVPTHDLIRRVWKIWHKRTDATEAFTSLSIMPSVTLLDIGNAVGMSNIQSHPFQKWSFELLQWSKDHNARNDASYNVTKAFNSIPSPSFADSANLLKLIWDHLQPGIRSGQCQLEILYAKYLLWGQCISYSIDQNGDMDEDLFKHQLEAYIRKICSNTGAQESLLSEILSIDKDGDPRFKLFEFASDQTTSPGNIIARATILCRIASNKLNDNIQRSRCLNAIEWIKRWLTEADIIGPGEEPSDLAIYIEDYQDAADQISTLTSRAAWTTAAGSAHMVGRLDRALCWAMDYDMA